VGRSLSSIGTLCCCIEGQSQAGRRRHRGTKVGDGSGVGEVRKPRLRTEAGIGQAGGGDKVQEAKVEEGGPLAKSGTTVCSRGGVKAATRSDAGVEDDRQRWRCLG
jgi:hypothetical protein